ncbi:MAG: MFS transporter [Sedimenticola sp.]|uniref:MFS transporter n=1 Tax=Sedimenticola thiotaurini TaxID=1543721 RepID=A0A558DEW3_9GAMM|nr:MFS transporter [Sedimenticola sp.]MCW8976281.1 MFS transporter [Sedimenticola sp.]TVT59554.1 MAG: MFS transporter [Sedimenticola thiotaurini]
MSKHSPLRLQLVVFALVAASFTNIYLTQPVLPVLQAEFAADTLLVSYTVAAVILGIALSNLPFGVLVDRLPIQPIILTGGIAVALAGLICAITDNLWLLIGARFLQGLFIPALTTCIAAYLAKSLPIERLNVVMGSYVSATVVGGLGGRLLGGWIHPPLHWRYAFVSAAILILAATFAALYVLPKQPREMAPIKEQPRFISLLRRWELVRIYLAAAGGFFIFSSIFNYLPFRLAAPPFAFSTELITLLYLVYVMGIFMGPLSGRISNRIGSGYTLIGGTLLLGISIALTLLPSIIAIILGLLGLCAGFFALHAAAVGSLNRRLTGGQGRANALYVLFYYVGGWVGITVSGFAYTQWGWQGVILICLLLLLLPFMAGIGEQRDASR